MEESFRSKLKATLGTTWNEILTEPEEEYCPELVSLIRELLHSKTKSYRYPVITQLLAKVVNPTLDTRSIQVTKVNDGQGKFDARSVCSKVVVPWEVENNCPLGGSNDPYVNNPLRGEEFSKAYSSNKKDVTHWLLLVELFDYVENHPEIAFNAFKQALLEVKRIQQGMNLEYPIPLRLSHLAVNQSIVSLLSTKSGGERLQLVCYALMFGMKTQWNIWDEVKTSKINASDRSERKAADVVCIKDGVTMLAIEVKDQDLTLELLDNVIRTARVENVRELMAFVNWKNPSTESTLHTRLQAEFANGMNIYVVNALEFLSFSLALLGEEGRKQFVIGVCRGLEIMNCSFATKREWAKILAEI